MIVVSDTPEFLFIQSTPSATWIIDHNLECFPVVVVIDSSQKTVEGEIEYITKNRVKVSFSGGFSGTAILR